MHACLCVCLYVRLHGPNSVVALITRFASCACTHSQRHDCVYMCGAHACIHVCMRLVLIHCDLYPCVFYFKYARPALMLVAAYDNKKQLAAPRLRFCMAKGSDLGSCLYILMLETGVPATCGAVLHTECMSFQECYPGSSLATDLPFAPPDPASGTAAEQWNLDRA